jgi:hypothetical protein
MEGIIKVNTKSTESQGKKSLPHPIPTFPEQTAENVDFLKKKISDQDLFTEIDKMLHYLWYKEK